MTKRATPIPRRQWNLDGTPLEKLLFCGVSVPLSQLLRGQFKDLGGPIVGVACLLFCSHLLCQPVWPQSLKQCLNKIMSPITSYNVLPPFGNDTARQLIIDFTHLHIVWSSRVWSPRVKISPVLEILGKNRVFSRSKY